MWRPIDSMFDNLKEGTQLMSIYTPYFYVIQDVRNGMYYAGSKYGQDANPSNFMVEGGYETSSETIKGLIRQYGLDNFIIRKIKTFKSSSEAHRYETRFLVKVNARGNPRFYNGHNNDGNLDPDKLKSIMMELYGVEYPMQSQIVREKSKLTNLRKRGVEYPMQCDYVKEKSKQTSIEKYATEHPRQSQIVKDNLICSTIEKYGVENVFQAAFVKNKIKETNIERYGVEHPSHSPELMEKKAQNNFEKYGVRCTFQIPEIREKALEKMWAENARQKRTNTNVKRYGVEVAASSPIVIEKVIETRRKLSERQSVLLLREYTRYFGIKLGEGWYQKSDDWLTYTLNEIQEKYGYYDYDTISNMYPKKKYSSSIKLLQDRPIVKQLKKYKEKYGRELKLGMSWDRKDNDYLEKLLSEVIETYGEI